MSVSASNESHDVVVRQLGRDGAELAVLEFQGAARELIISTLREGFLTTGKYAPDAKAISPQGATSLAFAGAATGATAISAATSSSLYMATANPASLMTIGNGVGSAVMGPSGIVAHAPFVAVSSALPVVAPILAMQALNTAVMMQEFKAIDQKLDTIKNTLDAAIARIEATHAGELLAASMVIDEIYSQYNDEGAFSTDMLLRLALAERDVRSLALRFRQLVETRNLATVPDLAAVHQANYDAHCAMLASFVELRISYLRVCVDLQENPKSVRSSTERLKDIIDGCVSFWQQLQERSSTLKDDIGHLEAKLQEMSWAERMRPGGGSTLEDDIKLRKEAYTTTMESERAIVHEFHSLIAAARATRKALDESTPASDASSPTLVYWTDESGDHAFVTEQKLLTPSNG